jgi:quercetin dioxygenase-like cupin family protein
MSGNETDMDDGPAEQAVFEAIAGALQPAELPAERRARMRTRILAGAAAVEPPAGTATYRGDDGWVVASEFVHFRMLRVDEAAGTAEMLVRLLPGVVVPEHSHAKEEQMVILEGECHVGEHLLRQGDVHVAPAGTRHAPITTRSGVLLFLRSEFPLPAQP